MRVGGDVIRFLQGDAIDVMKTLPAESIHCTITSPPYFALRSYLPNDHPSKHAEIGTEVTPAEFVAKLVAVFREVKRVLRKDGVCFVVIGDSYNNFRSQMGPGQAVHGRDKLNGKPAPNSRRRGWVGLKEKDLIGVPWMLAKALQAGFSTCTCGREMRSDLWPVHNGQRVCIDCLMEKRDAKIVETENGWWLRSEIIWNKVSCMPESVTDRCTRSHEQIFMLAKSGESTFWTHRDIDGVRSRPDPDYRWVHKKTGVETEVPQAGDEWKRINLWRGHDYFWDNEAVKEPAEMEPKRRLTPAGYGRKDVPGRLDNSGSMRLRDVPSVEYTHRNIRSVWTLSSEPFSGQHYASYPTKLVTTCISAGTSERGCCPHCGAQHIRVVSTEAPPKEQTRRQEYLTKVQVSRTCGAKTGGTNSTTFGLAASEMPSRRTTGFRQSCSCSPAAPIPATVLDPFAGSGTTGLVADRMQRDAILIDISNDYERMARERIQDDAPLFAQVT